MLSEIMKDAESRMKKSIEVLRQDLATLRAGRATPALLDKIFVDYYGAPTPINQLSNISVPEPRMLVIQPYDKSVINEIEKAILKSDLGVNPSNDGSVIRIVIPQLTEERRKELVKIVNKKGEEEKVAIRNIRRDANDRGKQLEKEKKVTEDELRKFLDDIQKITDKYVDEVAKVVERKEKEIMEV
jgi:ribosome recycling factor